MVEKDSVLTFHFLTASAALLCYVSLCYLRRRRLSRSPPLPPGPKGLPLLGSLPFLDPQLHSYFATLSNIYGPIFSIKLGFKLVVVVSSPSVARGILRDHDVIFANRDISEAGRILSYDVANLIWNPNGPTWRMLRKVTVREMLGGAPLKSMQERRQKQVAATISRVRENVDQPVNIGLETFTMMFNLVTSKLWGRNVEEGNDFGEELRLLVEDMIELLMAPNFSDFFPILARFDLQGVAAKTLAIRERFDQLFEHVLRKKKQQVNGGDHDFVDALLRVESESSDVGGKIPFTRNNLKGLLLDMIIAGTDTISSTVEFALAEMLNNPKIMKKAQEEADMVVGKDNIVQETHISKLQYLNAVIMETLRLHPPGPILTHCPSESCTINGYMIPKGTTVMINVWAIHRDPLTWEKPLEFIPERFLRHRDNDEEWDFSGNDLRYIPFGSGKRSCVGIGMARKIMPYLLASLLYSFNWRLPEGKELNIKEKFGLALKKVDPLIIVPTIRMS